MSIPLTVQMIVKNEDRWVWYAIASVINYASHLLIFDTGSEDKTVDIINTFPKNKITFEKKGSINPNQLTRLRQEQLERTKTNWFMIVDGDEIWPKNSVIRLLDVIKKSKSSEIGIVVKSHVCIGDILHSQDEKAGKYIIKNRIGHYNIRAYKKLESYHWTGEYPNEAYVNKAGIPIQNQENRLIFLDGYYWHLRHLPRSTKFKNSKRKFEIGKKIRQEDLPEVFFSQRPEIVSSPWQTYNSREKLISILNTPILYIKRRLL